MGRVLQVEINIEYTGEHNEEFFKLMAEVTLKKIIEEGKKCTI